MRKFIICLLALCMMLPAMRTNVSAEELVESVVEECLESGDFELNEDGKLVLTESGKELAKSQKYIFSLSSESFGISTKQASNPTDGVGIVYKNENKVVCSGVTEYVYYSHSEAKKIINWATNWKNIFGVVGLTNANAKNIVDYLFGYKLTGVWLEGAKLIVLAFGAISTFMTYFLKKVKPAYESAHANEGIVVTWFNSNKIISAKTQGF